MSYSIARILAVLICILTPVRMVMATRLPTDVELRASYCIPVVSSDATHYRDALQLIEEWAKENPDRIREDPVLAKKTRDVTTELQKSLEDTRMNLRRLLLYIAPRIEEVDPVSLVIANKRAEEDLGLLERIMPACIEKCTEDPDASACLNACAKGSIPGARERFELCRNLSWLPF